MRSLGGALCRPSQTGVIQDTSRYRMVVSMLRADISGEKSLRDVRNADAQLVQVLRRPVFIGERSLTFSLFSRKSSGREEGLAYVFLSIPSLHIVCA